MYVCLCNALTDHHVRDAASEGAKRPAEVHAACGCRAQCGSCVKAMLTMLRDLPATALSGYGQGVVRGA
ncbi:(2Fe-2S)-binding protein [Humitalea sp. 24SJ18S-53]|uniref:(2Fe-2S)-binding protein n=1 Tax=Humitalea sp. 24SJ18S-53 TaxID=3422307 RepID=UPI003D66BEC5